MNSTIIECPLFLNLVNFMKSVSRLDIQQSNAIAEHESKPLNTKTDKFRFRELSINITHWKLPTYFTSRSQIKNGKTSPLLSRKQVEGAIDFFFKEGICW